FEAVDETGDRVFTSPTPLMWDSAASVPGEALRAPAARKADTLVLEETGVSPGGVAGEDRAVAPQSGDRVAALPADLDAGAVTIVPDADMLTDPQTQWPVYIDPSISGSRNSWTVIRSGVPGTVAGYKFAGACCAPGSVEARH